MVRVKAIFDGEIRRFSLLKDAKYIQFYEQLCTLFSSSNLIVKYTDDEGDLVALESDVELAEAISIADKEDALLRISVGVIDETTETKVPPPTVSTEIGSKKAVESSAEPVKEEKKVLPALKTSKIKAKTNGKKLTSAGENIDKSTFSIHLKELDGAIGNSKLANSTESDKTIDPSDANSKALKAKGKPITDTQEANGVNISFTKPSSKNSNRRVADRKKDSGEPALSTAAKRRLKLSMK